MLPSLFKRREEEFQSCYPVEEAVLRLSRALLPKSTLNPFRHGLVGTVTSSAVHLRYSDPVLSIMPIASPTFVGFSGSFVARPQGAALHGSFSSLLYLRIFVPFWFGFVFLGGLVAVFSHSPDHWSVAGGIALMAVGGACVVAIIYLAERRDIKRIRRRVMECLSGGG